MPDSDSAVELTWRFLHGTWRSKLRAAKATSLLFCFCPVAAENDLLACTDSRKISVVALAFLVFLVLLIRVKRRFVECGCLACTLYYFCGTDTFARVDCISVIHFISQESSRPALATEMSQWVLVLRGTQRRRAVTTSARRHLPAMRRESDMGFGLGTYRAAFPGRQNCEYVTGSPWPPAYREPTYKCGSGSNLRGDVTFVST
jgi:hypothetical protein